MMCLCFQPPSSRRAWTPHLNSEMRHFAGRTRQTIGVIAGTGANLSIEVGRKTLRLGMLHLKVDMTNEGRVRITPAWSPLDSALDADSRILRSISWQMPNR